MHVLRLVALGRINTPEQVAFCEKLEKALAEPVKADPVRAALDSLDAYDAAAEAAPKRTRKPKAD